MKPNFALSLSLDGILLLHDTATGWRPVGKADPASPSLAEDLDALKRKAAALDPSGLRCKLVIPQDQVRYLTLHTPGLDETARRQAAGRALEDITPYALTELAFDICPDGDETHVAGVARETLDEAEQFALAHGMYPVCFAADPHHAGFSGEPSFGMTKAAGDQEIDAQAPASGAIDDAPDPTGPEDSASVDDPEPSFVSRRTVPTFRTDETEFGLMAQSRLQGFAEDPAPFQGAQAREANNQAPARPPLPAPAGVARKSKNEEERLTIFGARSGDGATDRFAPAGLLVLILVVVVAGVGAFASGALGSRVTAFLDRVLQPEETQQFTAPLGAAEPSLPDIPTAADAEAVDSVDLAALEQRLSDEDAAVLDALRVEPLDLTLPEPEDDLPDPTLSAPLTGIWQTPPEVPEPPSLVGLDDLYITSIDPINVNFDAVALPDLSSEQHDLGYLAPASPAPAGTVFRLDDRAMVIATPDGAMNPDGVLIFAGPPAVKPPLNLLKAEDPGIDLSERLRLAAFRPQSRPGDLIETSERAVFSGLTRSELNQMRPRMRPISDQENALASASLVRLDDDGSQSLLKNETDNGFDEASGRALAASLRPDARPKDFSDTVAKAEATAPRVLAVTATAVAPRAVTPKIPSSASATREATVKNALNLNKVNLIGVYGTPSDRRALVRMGNGSYRKVKVGDSIDGGQVSAIGDAELRYQKSGRAVVLKMPRG